MHAQGAAGQAGGRVSVGTGGRRRAVFQQQERHVVVAVTAGVPVHGRHQRIQRLLAVGGRKRSRDRAVGEEALRAGHGFRPARRCTAGAGRRATSSP